MLPNEGWFLADVDLCSNCYCAYLGAFADSTEGVYQELNAMLDLHGLANHQMKIGFTHCLNCLLINFEFSGSLSLVDGRHPNSLKSAHFHDVTGTSGLEVLIVT